MLLRSGKRKSFERTPDVDKDDRAVESNYSIESLPDALLLLIIQKAKKFTTSERFIKTVASINKRFQRLCRTGSLWDASNLSSKAIIKWVVKHVDLSAVCFDSTLWFLKLEDFSPLEITTAFDKLGRYVKGIGLIGFREQDGYDMIYSGYAVSILKSCSNLTKLDSYLRHVSMGTLIRCIEYLPLLAHLSANLAHIDQGTGAITPLVNTLCKRCPALKFLKLYSRALVYDRSLFKITGLVSLSVHGGVLATELLRDLASLTYLEASDVVLPTTLLISCNSIIQLLSLRCKYGEGGSRCEIDRCSELRHVDLQCRNNINSDVCVRKCPQLTSLFVARYQKKRADVEKVQVRFDGCPAINELCIIGHAFSEDIYRLTCLTSLTVALLDGRDDWPVQVFLDCLNKLDSLVITHHTFNETELTVASPCLRAFKIIYPSGFKVQTLRMQCPKLEELKLTEDDTFDFETQIRDKDEMDNAEGGGLQCIDLSVCAYLKDVVLDCAFVHSLSLEWILDLFSNGRNQELIKRFSIVPLINRLDRFQDRLVCKERFNL